MTESTEQKEKSIPECIGIIMDGNRRWSKEKGLPKLEGHRVGYSKVKEVLDWCIEAGVKSLIVYAFSTENWNRAQDEVAYLLHLLAAEIGNMAEDAKQKNIQLIFLGERTRFSKEILASIRAAEEKTRLCDGFQFGIALSYGGRAEIIDAIHRIPKEKLTDLSEGEFERLLWTRDMPDPDMLIRTSGEQRLSGFLTWQSVYSELFFTDTYWPAFTKDEFLRMLSEYGERQRRFGT